MMIFLGFCDTSISGSVDNVLSMLLVAGADSNLPLVIVLLDTFGRLIAFGLIRPLIERTLLDPAVRGRGLT